MRPPLKYLIFLLVFGLPLALFAYMGSFTHPFRSDAYIEYNLFNTLSFNLTDLIKVSSFEMFGDKRFQPLACLLTFIQYKLFGNNLFFHHIFQFMLHFINSILLYIFLKNLHKNYLAASIVTILFLTFYSHFDIINWTYHFYIVFQCTLILLGFICIQKYFQRMKANYIFTSITLLFVSIFLYEANILIPIFGVLFFILLFDRRNYPDFLKFKKGLIIAISCIFTSYIIFGCLYYLSQTYIAGTQDVTLYDIFRIKNLPPSISIMAHTFWMEILNNLGFPSRASIIDLVHLQTPLTWPLRFIIVFLLIAFIILISTRMKRRDVRLMVLFSIMSISYIFIISLGRSVTDLLGYVSMQPRYQYFPNLIAAIIIFLLISDGSIFKIKNSYRFMVVFLLSIAVLNAVKIHNHTALISKGLSPMRQHYLKIKEFYLKNKDSNSKIFINFLVRNNAVFNLGADISLDVYFHKEGIITKDINKAKYIYDKDKGIYPNPLYLVNLSNNRDFTIEFLYTQDYFYRLKDFTIVGKKDGPWSLEITKDGRIRFKGFWIKDGLIKQMIFNPKDIILLGWRWNYIIVERQKDKFYIILNNKIIFVKDISGYSIDLNKDTAYILGDIYSGYNVRGLANGLFVTIGRANYNLKDKAIGDYIDIKWEPPW